MVKKGLGLKVNFAQYRHLPGKIKGVKNDKAGTQCGSDSLCREQGGTSYPGRLTVVRQSVLEVTARNLEEKDPKKQVLYSAQKTWFEIGVDMDRDMRYGAWQIKEIIDLTLPPSQTQKVEHLMNFDTDTEEVKIEVKLLYYISGGKR